MLKKLFVGALLSTAVSAGVDAQQTGTMQLPLPEINNRQIIIYNNGGNSYLGVQAQEVTKENFGKFGLREVRGAAIEKVTENSPAARAGLQNGDVIVKFNGEEVESVRKLTRLIGETAPDHQAVLTISRSGSEREVTVTLEKRKTPEMPEGSLNNFFGAPEMPSLPQIQMPPNGRMMQIPRGENNDRNVFVYSSNSRQIGVSAVSLSKQLADYFGAGDGGILINSVRENSPAAKAGLKAGDVIIEIDGVKVGDVPDLPRTFGAKTEGDFNLTIIRNKNRQNVRVTPETVKGGNVEIEKYFENAAPKPNADN